MKAQWLVEITVTLLGIFTAAACAEGSVPKGSGNGGEGGENSWAGPASSSSSSSSSSAGMGGAGGSSSSNGAGGASASSSASSASSSGVCLETPCQLVSPQCGCGAGDMCLIDGSPEGTRVCVAAGSVPIGGECSGSNCSAGSMCVISAGMKSSCRKFCSMDAHCTAPGGLCVTKLNDGSSGQIPGVTLCSDNCDPLTNVGCSVTGMSCQVFKESGGQLRHFTSCAGSGSGTQGASCTNSANCAPTFGCFNVGTSQCVKYCKVVGGVCPGGLMCAPVGKVGSTEYGVCL